MNNYTKHTNHFREVYSELKNEIERTQQEATKALRVHRDKLRLHMDSKTFNSDDYLNVQEEWNRIDQKLKTLSQIKSILENHLNSSGEIKDLEILYKELQSYINIATKKKLYDIANIFKNYETQLIIKDSEIYELIKLKIKEDSNSHFIKETFLKACQSLDASIFEPLILEDQYFEDLDKYRFLQSMKTQFDYLKGNKVKEVQLVLGTCKMCFTGERIYEFYVEPKKGKPAFAYNIQEVNGEIKDIFRCNYSDGYEREAKGYRNQDVT